MEEKDYQLLLELYETKNITKVANKLFLTQPALTKRIKRMEDELGCQLFLRSKKGILFTSVGEDIIPYAKHICQLGTEMRDHINLTKGIIGGTLNLGSSLNYSHYRLPNILKRYSNLYPAVDVHITTNQSTDLYRMLKREEISIAITRGDFPWDEGKVLVRSEPMCIVCSNEFRDTPLSDFPYIGRKTDSALMEKLSRWRAEQGLEQLPIKLWTDNIDSAKEMAAAGLGWCFLPQICLEHFDGCIKEMYFKDGTPLMRKTYILYKNAYFELAQVQLFIQQLLAYEAGM